MAEEKSGKLDRIEIYKRLLNIEDIGNYDSKAFAESVKLSPQALGGMIGQLKTNPGIRRELQSLGYSDEQIPNWVAKSAPLESESVVGLASESPVPANPPTDEVAPKTTEQPGRPTKQANQTGQLGGLTRQAGLASAAYEAANRVLGQSGQHIEALGSDALDRWIRENGVEEMNGVYWQRTRLPTGQVALVQVQPPREVIEAEQLGNAELSSMMFRSLEGETQALMKKVAFNPEAFTYYNWAKRKGFLRQDKDFADFVNYCITLTMTKIFGARIGVVVNTDNTLMAMLREKRIGAEVEYAT